MHEESTTSWYKYDGQIARMLCYTSIDEIDDISKYTDKLDESQQQYISKYKFKPDQKRALLSILLQKTLIEDFFQIQTSEMSYTIRRTEQSKPYVRLKNKVSGYWNYNVSHHGKYVCIGADERYLVGIDIVDISTRFQYIKNFNEFMDIYVGQLTPSEISLLKSQTDERLQYVYFFIIWSLKESYIKAIGIGLGYDLQKISFTFEIADEKIDSYQQPPVQTKNSNQFRGSAVVAIDGVLNSDWKFDFTTIDSNHVLTVARGPLNDAIQEYQSEAWRAQSIDLRTSQSTTISLHNEFFQRYCKCCFRSIFSSHANDSSSDLHHNPLSSHEFLNPNVVSADLESKQLNNSWFYKPNIFPASSSELCYKTIHELHT